MAPGAASGQPLPQPEASRSHSTLQPSLPSPPHAGPRKSPWEGLLSPRGLGIGVLGPGGGRAARGAQQGGGHPLGAQESRGGTRPDPGLSGGSTCVLGPGRPPSDRAHARAPLPPQRAPARGVSPHGAIGPAADVRRGHVGLGQLPGGLVDVLLVEAPFPGEAHPAHSISTAPVRWLHARSAGLPAPGPRPPRAARSSPARGRGRPRRVPPAGLPRCAARPRPDRPRHPLPEPRVPARTVAKPGRWVSSPEEGVLSGRVLARGSGAAWVTASQLPAAPGSAGSSPGNVEDKFGKTKPHNFLMTESFEHAHKSTR